MRWFWNLLGLGALGLGVVGVFVPLLPTTPFVLVSAACFGRGSRQLHAWLLTSRLAGPALQAWQRERRIPRRAVVAALALLWSGLPASLVAVQPPAWAAAGLLAIAATASLFLLARIQRKPA